MSNRKKIRTLQTLPPFSGSGNNGEPPVPSWWNTPDWGDANIGHTCEILNALMDAIGNPGQGQFDLGCDDCNAWVTAEEHFLHTITADMSQPISADNHPDKPKMPACFTPPLNHGRIDCGHPWLGGTYQEHRNVRTSLRTPPTE